MVRPALLLQTPSAKSKSRDLKEALKRQFALWQKSELIYLLKEAQPIPSQEISAISKKFLMKSEKINAAIKLLTAKMQGGLLPLSEETMPLLHEKQRMQ